MGPRNPTGAIKALLDEQTREMYGFVDSAARPLNGALQEPRNQVAAALYAFLAKKSPDEPFTQTDYQKALIELRRTPDIQLAQMGGARVGTMPAWVKPLRADFESLLKKKSAEAGEMATRHAAQQANALRVPVNAVSAEEVQRLGGKELNKRLTKYADEQAKGPYEDIKRRLGIGLLAGLTLGELVTDLMRVGRRKGPLPDVANPQAVAEAIADSLFGVASRSARRVAVTELANAYNVQMLVAMDEMGVTMKRWDSSNDQKVCTLCRDAHGRVVPLDKHFPNGSMGPPLHPHCRCCLTVWRDRTP